MEFKNLAEVTKLEEVPEGASVLAATAEGEVVRVPGEGLGGGGADWNAAEGEPGYIANKPFGQVNGIMVHETSVSAADQYDYTVISKINGPFIDGGVYTVTLNGVVYECTAWNDGYGAVYIGNGNIFGIEKGDDSPFVCDSYPNGEIGFNANSAGEYTVSISGPYVKQIEPSSVNLNSVSPSLSAYYYFGAYSMDSSKTYYAQNGTEVTFYKCSWMIQPETVLIGTGVNGIVYINAPIGSNNDACAVVCHVIRPSSNADERMRHEYHIYGTSSSAMHALAEELGYSTVKPS